MSNFYRGNYTNVIIVVRSNEELAILDSDYIEDYNGVDGQVSLYHIATDSRYPVPVVGIPSMTPTVPNDYFRGTYPLASLPNGDYQLQFRVRDIGGNYVISGAVSAPIGTESISTLTMTILPGTGMIYVVDVGPLLLRGSYNVDARREELHVIGVDREATNPVIARRQERIIVLGG